MANEATLIFQTGIPIPFTCANGTGIEKGALLALTDPMTAATHSAVDQQCAGIAAAEKIANDGVTKIPVFRQGIFKVLASGSITAGYPLALADAEWVNRVYAAEPGVSGSRIIGTALETASAGETFLMELNIGIGGTSVS